MRARTCLLAQGADTNLSRNGHKKRKKRKHRCQKEATWQNQGPRRAAGEEANWQKIEEKEKLSREKSIGFSYTGNPLKVLIYSRVKAVSSEVRKEAKFPQGISSYYRELINTLVFSSELLI